VKLHNVDKALTSEPTPDQWADHDELSEDTGSTANVLIVGRRADSLFAAAHAAGAELRQARRQRAAPGPPEQAPPPKEGDPPRVGKCSDCGRYAVADGWHAPCGSGTIHLADVDDSYYENLASFASMKQPKHRRDVAPEWRETPGYPGYEIHSVTRELRRLARDTVGKDGRVRHLSARPIKAHNGAYSLSVNGVKSTRGVQALWNETFSESAEKKKTTGDNHYHTTPPQDYSYGIAEWIGEGGACIVTRPK
jgi:hypothetical protein